MTNQIFSMNILTYTFYECLMGLAYLQMQPDTYHYTVAGKAQAIKINLAE